MTIILPLLHPDDPFYPYFAPHKESLFFFKSEEEYLLLRVSQILNAKSFCIFVKMQQDQKTSKHMVYSILFLIQPVKNIAVFKRLKKILGFGEVVMDPVDKSYVLFRIR